jgi:transcriptional regulator GlxA family with amidase domain
MEEQPMLRTMDEPESEGFRRTFRPIIPEPESGTPLPGAPIDDNIDQRISVELLAGLAKLSVRYFVRAFKQSMDVTPHDYLMRQRVERTKELLADADMPLSEIALLAGFADQSHLARRFRQHVGMSPRDYRWSSA